MFRLRLKITFLRLPSIDGSRIIANMDEFTTSRIFTNLLVATQWTIILSLIVFVTGGIVGFLITLMLNFPKQMVARRELGLYRVLSRYSTPTTTISRIFRAFGGVRR